MLFTIIMSLLFLGSFASAVENTTNSTEGNYSMINNTFGTFVNYTVSCNANATCFYSLPVPIQTIYIDRTPIINNYSILNQTQTEELLLKYCAVNYTTEDNFRNLDNKLSIISEKYNTSVYNNYILNKSLFLTADERDYFRRNYINISSTCEQKLREEPRNWGIAGLLAGGGGIFWWLKRKKIEKEKAVGSGLTGI